MQISIKGTSKGLLTAPCSYPYLLLSWTTRWPDRHRPPPTTTLLRNDRLLQCLGVRTVDRVSLAELACQGPNRQAAHIRSNLRGDTDPHAVVGEHIPVVV